MGSGGKRNTYSYVFISQEQGALQNKVEFQKMQVGTLLPIHATSINAV